MRYFRFALAAALVLVALACSSHRPCCSPQATPPPHGYSVTAPGARR